MTPNNITRAIVDATVERGLKEVDEDPKRSIRKLADMGHRFSNGRFLDEVYDIVQDLLRNDDSPYYTTIELLLRNTDRKNLKEFCINMGYNALTYGGKILRQNEKKKDYDIPWCLNLRLDSSMPGSLNPADVEHLVMQGNQLGIFAFVIRCRGRASSLNSLFRIFASQPNSAFICALPDDILTQTQLGAIRQCSNTLFLIPFQAASSVKNMESLRKWKVLFGMYDIYTEKTASSWITGNLPEKLTECGTAFNILIAGDECSTETREKITKQTKSLRTQPKYPYFMFHQQSDVQLINQIVSEHNVYFELLENGDILTGDDIPLKYRHTLSLEQMFAFALKK